MGKSDKLRAIFKGMKAFRSFRKILSKVPEKYFSSTYVRKNPFNIIPDKIFSDADVILVARDDDDYRRRDEIKTSDYVADLMRRGISREKIFVVPREMFSAEIPVVEDGKLSPLCRNVNDTKPVLRYMEYHVTDFCNLKCKGCGHMANYVKELEFPGADSFRQSLMSLAEKFRNILVMRLMGGEPLLCRNLHEYINTAHEIFPYSQIKIVTNGLLLCKNMTDETIAAVRNAGAEIQVTQYPPTRKIAEEITAFCREHGMKLSISGPVHDFFRGVITGEDTDAAECWFQCESRYCHFLNGTTFYPCPRIWTNSSGKFRDIVKDSPLSRSITDEYYYDLSREVSHDGWDILAKFETPMEICRKCRNAKVFFKWESEIPQYNE